MHELKDDMLMRDEIKEMLTDVGFCITNWTACYYHCLLFSSS